MAETAIATQLQREGVPYTLVDTRTAGRPAIDAAFLTAAGPVLNEVNTMPGFAEQSQVPKMFAAAGLGYHELLDLLVRDAMG